MSAKKRYLIFLIGLLFFAACGIRWNVPAAAWLWPVFILLFLRKSKSKSSFIITLIAFALLGIIKSFGALDCGAVLDHLIGVVIAIISFLPFLADRFFAGSLKGLAKTLVFPLTCVVLELLQSFTPLGIIDAFSTTQADFKSLVQIASVFGAYGLVFIVMWLAPVVCEVVDYLEAKDSEKASKSFKKPLIAYCLVLIMLLSFGGLRLASSPIDSMVVKAALTTGPYIGSSFDEYGDGVSEFESLQSIEKSAQTAAGGKADILLFCEEAFSITKAEEDSFISAASSIAKKYSMPMIVGLDLSNAESDDGGLNENKLVYINALGEKGFEYLKSKTIPFVEDDYVSGDGQIPLGILKTNSGKELNISAVICFDSDHPSYIRNALSKQADILLVPTWDWDAIRSYHTKWVEYRAVENGVSLVRSTYNGVSTATDSYGRVTMYSDTASSGYETVVFAQVPINRMSTVYGSFGDVIDLLYIAALLALCTVSIIRRRKPEHEELCSADSKSKPNK